MNEAQELAHKIYLEIKSVYPDFEERFYDASGNIYYGQTSSYVGKNGNGFKLFKSDNKWFLGVKNNLQTGTLNDYVFNLPNQFKEARANILKLYDINVSSSLKDIMSDKDIQLLEKFENALNKHGIDFERRENKSYYGYKSPFDDKWTAFRIGLEKGKIILKVKKYFPLSSEMNTDNDGVYSIILVSSFLSNFNSAIKRIDSLYETGTFYTNVLNANAFQTLVELLNDKNDKILNIFGFESTISIKLNNRRNIKIINKNGNVIAYVTLSTGEVFDLLFNDDNILNIYSLLVDGKLDEIKKQKETQVKKEATELPKAAQKQEISKEAEYFIKEVKNIPTTYDDKTLEILFDLYDELTVEDCENKDVNECYEILNMLRGEEEQIPSSVRFVYVTKNFLKEIDELDNETKESINEIRTKLSSLKDKNLYNFLVSKQLVYISNYLKIRVKNGLKHRIIFCFGDKLGKNPKDLYLFEYNKTHNFSNIDNIHPQNQQYSLWSIVKKQISVPPLTGAQEKISTSINKPLICTGCAGSGKTLISVYMYTYLLDKEYFGDSNVGSNELIYVTYNENAKNNALGQLKEVVESANTKTIFEFFYDIALPDFKDKKFADEVTFENWWKNKITDHTFLVKINSLSKNAIKYVYTFYRGLYKGSMYRWELDENTPHLNYEKFNSLMHEEPIKQENIDLIYQICEKYSSYLIANNYFDDNDLARIAIKRIKLGLAPKYKHIIIDEVQDLTEVQLDAVVKASIDKRCLYFFGDQNQSINPTLFNLDFIEMCLKINDSSIEKSDIYTLRSSYRFGPLLAKYINKLIYLKQQYIGKTAIEETESSNKNPEKNRWAGKTFDPKLINDILLKASNSANAIIIVPDANTKIALINKYGDEFGKRVTTIYDSKGLEWDYVILYNMLKSNEDKYMEMISNNAKHSTLHRMIFNQYYVGCTRALTCFSILEENLDIKISSPMIEDLQTITERSVNLYLEENNDSTSWYQEATRLFDAGIYDLALNAFEKAGITFDEEPKMEICSIIFDEKTPNIEKAKYCRNKGFYKEAGLLYLKAGQNRLAKLMNLYVGINITNDEAWDLIQNEKLNEQDMVIINKSGILINKSNKIRNQMSNLLKKIKE